ncbi:MAG: menaquinone-dependent protoporphyrinogen IX dehydrogenase [Steroidobacteraceae bacterium]
MARILLLHKGVYGHTLKIAEFLQREIEARGHAVVVRPLEQGAADGAGFDAIVVGASIRHGKHNPAVMDFIRDRLALLQSKPSAFFSVNLVARKPAKNTPETNPYARAFLAKSPWKPSIAAVFGGVLDYQRYGPFDRYAIRFIMKLTNGPTDLHTNTEFTDWEAVRRFAGRISAIASGQPA